MLLRPSVELSPPILGVLLAIAARGNLWGVRICSPASLLLLPLRSNALLVTTQQLRICIYSHLLIAPYRRRDVPQAFAKSCWLPSFSRHPPVGLRRLIAAPLIEDTRK